MAASSQATPAGSINYVGFDYLSAKTAATDIVIRTLGGTEFASIDMTNEALKIDTINEFTSAAGVTIDSVLIKDGSAVIAHNTYFQAYNNAAAATDVWKLNGVNKIELAATVESITVDEIIFNDGAQSRAALFPSQPSYGTDDYAFDPSTSPRRVLDTVNATTEEIAEYAVTIAYDLINSSEIFTEAP